MSPVTSSWGNKLFIHAFSSHLELKSESTDSGFEVLDLYLPENEFREGLQCPILKGFKRRQP